MHYGMDWDLWIRLGCRWPVVYLPEVLAQSRDYRQTKTASGGWRRFRELRSILARHGARGWLPGALIYGLETLKREFPFFFGTVLACRGSGPHLMRQPTSYQGERLTAGWGPRPTMPSRGTAKPGGCA